MKKSVSFVLALLMVVSVWLPLTAAGADELFRVESTGGTFATLNEAVAAAEAGDTITLLGDYDASGEQNQFAIEKNVTVDGGGHTVTGSAYLWFLAAPAGTTLTFRNLTVSGTHGFRVRATGQTVVMENVTANLTNGLFMNLQIQNASPGEGEDTSNTVTLKDCSIVHSGSGGFDPILAVYGKADWTVNLNNTSLLKSTDAKTHAGNMGNNATIYINTGKNVEINLGSGSVIGAARAYSAGDTISCVHNQANSSNPSANVTLNLLEGSQLRIDDESSNHTRFFTYAGAADRAMTVRDAGCTYVLSEIAAQTGVTLPEVTLAGNEEAEPEFVSGDTVVQTGRVFADALAQGEVRFAARASAEPPVRDPQADAGKYFRIGDTYYDNLKTALEAANEGETVTMIQGGYRYTSGGQIVVDAANVTFDGNGFDLFTNQSYAIKVLASGFTLKNIYCYSVNQLLEFNPTGEDDQLTLENVTAIANRGLLINGTRNDYKADSTATVTFRNSQLTTANNAEEVILLREKVHITLSIEGSALVNRGNSTHTYAVQSGKSDGYNRTIRVDGASTLVYSAAQKGMVIYAQSDPACTIHLAEGAVLRLEDTLAGSVFINENQTVHDAGAVYTANAAALRNGVGLPEVLLGEQTRLLGYALEGAGLVGSSYTNADAVNDAAFRAVGYNAADFVLLDGASIRTADPYGIRFTAQVSDELYRELLDIDENVEFGMIVAPTKKVFGGFDVSGMVETDYVRVPVHQWAEETADGARQYRVAMYAIPETKEGFTTALSAMAYFTVHFADGSEHTIYTVYNQEVNSRSLYDVAKAAYADGMTDNAVINRILSLVEA